MQIIKCPSKTVRAWVEKNPNKVREVDMIPHPWAPDRYNILLERGWCTDYEPGLHTIIEDTVAEAMRSLRASVPCSCNDCITGEGW